ncbi:MAG: hypothetical protein MR292_06495 [Alistipes sp.]|nr:hypothetical protein [Alistipes sp.]
MKLMNLFRSVSAATVYHAGRVPADAVSATQIYKNNGSWINFFSLAAACRSFAAAGRGVWAGLMS